MGDELPIVQRLRAGPVFHSISDMQTMHEAAALITELVAALEPFAAFLGGENVEDSSEWIFTFKAGDIRRARAVLEKVKGDGNAD